MNISRISLVCKKWYDKTYGNTYFSCRVLVDNEVVTTLEFQSGYGEHFKEEANRWLNDNGYIDNPSHSNGSRTPLWHYCEANNIILNSSEYEVKTQKQCQNDKF